MGKYLDYSGLSYFWGKLKDKFIRKDAECMTTNPFRPHSFDGVYISKIDNGLYAANKRWTVTLTGTQSNSSSDRLFDGSYETRVQIAASGTGVVLIDFANTTYFPGYPYGYILVSFYYNEQPANVSGRVYCNYASQGVGWKDIAFTRVSDSTTTACVYRSAHQGYYNISQMEITVVAGSSSVAGISQIELHLDRPHPSYQPFVSKYTAETLYYNLTAPKFIGALQGNADTATNSTKVNNHTVNSDVPANAVFTDTKVTQTGITTSGDYPILLKNTTGTTDVTNSVNYGKTTNKLITANPSSGNIKAESFNGITIMDDGADGIYIASAEGSLNIEGGCDYTLGDACTKSVGSVTSGNTGLVTGGDVYTAIQNAGGGGGRVATYYTTSATGATTAAKVITISGWTPTAGDILGVKFTYANTAATPTLNVNSAGAKSIYVGNATPNSTTNPLRWAAGDMVYFQFDGTYYRYITKAPLKTCLYNNATGTSDTVTLSVTAANFNFMRIYFKKTNGQNQVSSVDIYSPNQKYVNLTIFEPYASDKVAWFASRTVYINGTSITTYDYANGQIGQTYSGGSGNEIAIYRVEAW